MKSKILETRLAQVAMILTLAGSTTRVFHLFENNNSNIGYILLGAGIILMSLAIFLRSRHNKQKKNQEQKDEARQLNHQ